MQSVWNEDIIVKSYEVDYNKKLKLNSMFNYMQEAAFNHACSLGAGYEDLLNQGFIWVLSRVSVKIIKYPEWREKINLETWPKGVNKLFALRDFIIRDETNEKVALATTAWLVLDTKSMRPQRVQALRADLPDNQGAFALNEELEKIENQDEFEFEIERTAAYSDIDVNKHVNNAKYVEWIIDSFPKEFFSSSSIKSFKLNFLTETKLGDRVVIKRGSYNGLCNVYYIEAINKASGSKIFQSVIEAIE